MPLLHLALSLIALQVPVSPPNVPPPPQRDQVFARVNGQAITAADVESLLWEWRAKEVTQDLVSYLLVAQDAAKKGVVVADAEVNKALEEERASFAKNMGVSPERALESLEEQGFTTSRLFLRIKAKLLLDKIVAGGFKPEQYVDVSTIVVKPASAEASALSQAIVSAEKAYQRLESGEAWDKVQQEATTDPRVRGVKGKLGWKERTAFPESVQADMRNLKVGGLTKPVQTPNGIQIFRVDALGSEVKGEELEALKRMYMESARQAHVERLRNEAKIERLLK